MRPTNVLWHIIALIFFLIENVNLKRRPGDLNKIYGLSNEKEMADLFFYHPLDLEPDTGLKPPIDLLEMSMRKPKDEEEARKLYQSLPLSRIQLLLDKMPEEIPPRKQFEFQGINTPNIEAFDDEENHKVPEEIENYTRPLLIDFVSNQQRNLLNPGLRSTQVISKNHTTKEEQPIDYLGLNETYSDKDYVELSYSENMIITNWTTCEEFGKGAYFHPTHVVGIKWIPFYIWTDVHKPTFIAASIVHSFSYPSQRLVAKYKVELGPYVSQDIDWNQPKLLMQESREVLLVSRDRKGTFDAIPYQEIPESVKGQSITVPTMTLKMKLLDPYLGLMFCDNDYATIMAVIGNVPPTDKEKEEEARMLNFTGTGFPVTSDTESESFAAFSKHQF